MKVRVEAGRLTFEEVEAEWVPQPGETVEVLAGSKKWERKIVTGYEVSSLGEVRIKFGLATGFGLERVRKVWRREMRDALLEGEGFTTIATEDLMALEADRINWERRAREVEQILRDKLSEEKA